MAAIATVQSASRSRTALTVDGDRDGAPAPRSRGHGARHPQIDERSPDRGADVGCHRGAVARYEHTRPERDHRRVDGDHADADREAARSPAGEARSRRRRAGDCLRRRLDGAITASAGPSRAQAPRRSRTDARCAACARASSVRGVLASGACAGGSARASRGVRPSVAMRLAAAHDARPSEPAPGAREPRGRASGRRAAPRSAPPGRPCRAAGGACAGDPARSSPRPTSGAIARCRAAHAGARRLEPFEPSLLESSGIACGRGRGTTPRHRAPARRSALGRRATRGARRCERRRIRLPAVEPRRATTRHGTRYRTPPAQGKGPYQTNHGCLQRFSRRLAVQTSCAAARLPDLWPVTPPSAGPVVGRTRRGMTHSGTADPTAAPRPGGARGVPDRGHGAGHGRPVDQLEAPAGSGDHDPDPAAGLEPLARDRVVQPRERPARPDRRRPEYERPSPRDRQVEPRRRPDRTSQSGCARSTSTATRAVRSR